MILKTADGAQLRVPPKTLAHLQAHRGVLDILPEAAARVRLPGAGRRLQETVDLGRPIGPATRVSTPPRQPQAPGTFALRVGRPWPSRVEVVAQPPFVCTLLIAAGPTGDPAIYELITAFLGTQAPPEPWSCRPSLRFWCGQALVYDAAVMGPAFTSSWSRILDAAGRRR